MSESLQNTARSILGFPLSEVQKQVVLSFLDGHDAIFRAPTGYGKSAPHQIAGSVLPPSKNRIIVVSPLLALISDQMKSLPTVFSQTSLSDETSRFDKSAQYIFTTPESLLAGRGRELLSDKAFTSTIGLVVIDECHVIKLYEETKKKAAFRELYGKLGQLRTFLNCPMLCLTATATHGTLSEISTILGLKNPHTHTVNDSKKNITYHRVAVDNDLPHNFYWLVHLILKKEFSRRMLIYFRSRPDAGNVYDFVTAKTGQSVTDIKKTTYLFHRTTPDQEKDSILAKLSLPNIDNSMMIVLCTSSLGLGLNFKDIDYVVHYGVPTTTEEFLQETGRAARELERHGHAVLLTFPGMQASDLTMKLVARSDTCILRLLNDHFDIKTVRRIDCCDICNWALCVDSPGGIFSVTEPGTTESPATTIMSCTTTGSFSFGSLSP